MVQKSPIMEPAQNHLECDTRDNVSSSEELSLCNQLSSEDNVMTEQTTNSAFPGIHDFSKNSEINSAVLSQKIPAESPSAFHDLAVNTVSENGKVSDNCNDELYDTNDLLMVGSKLPLDNAFEKEANQENEISNNGDQMKINKTSFKLSFNNNAHQGENMCIENIEDENMGRMVYNNREPLSMIMEGNSPVTEVAPVAEVAPIIVVNQNNEIETQESSTFDISKKKELSTKHKTSRNSLKSEIILPSKSKIPQGIRGIKAMPGSNRLYLTGLKKSSSLNSPLSAADFSPRSQTFSEQDASCIEQYNNASEFSGASTPMSNLIEVGDIRSKLKMRYSFAL